MCDLLICEQKEREKQVCVCLSSCIPLAPASQQLLIKSIVDLANININEVKHAFHQMFPIRTTVTVVFMKL